MNRLARSRYSRVSWPEATDVGHHGITERAAEPIEDGRPQQEGLDGFGLPLEDFFDQVVEHEVVAAGERRDEACDVFAALQ